MKKLITILLLILFTFKANAQTANAGADQTIYLTSTNSATLDGSASSGTSYKWTEISSDYTSGAIITNSTSKIATVSPLPQGVWYFEIAVTTGVITVRDTTAVIVDYDIPPAGGTQVEGLPISGISAYANNRTLDTTVYIGYTFPNNYPDSHGHTIYMERSILPCMWVDAEKLKFTSQIRDGYAWNYSGYARAECTYGAGYGIDTNKVYCIEWKGYFPQDSFYLNLSGVTWAAAVVFMQIHANNALPPPFGISIGYHGNIFVGETPPNQSTQDSLTIGQYADYYNTCHTIRVQFKEGLSSSAFIKVYVDGVLKYSRTTGGVGATFMQDYFKMASVYDYGNRIVDVNNHTRNRRFSLVTESYKVFEINGSSPVTLTWATPAAITYGTLLSSTQLNCSAGSVAGTMSYNYPIGTKLNAGTYTLTATFTPTDLTTYSVTQKSVTLVINKATATMTYSNTTQTYTGNPLSVTVTTSPVGLSGVTTTYNNVAAPPTNADSYSLLSALSNPNYTATNITGTFTINKATATISASNLNQTYTGSPLSITASVSPSVSGLGITYNGSSTPPTNARTYTAIITLTNSNYQATPDTVTFTINKATPTVLWTTPAAITYGTALSGTQLNATSSVAGTFTYTPASGTIPNAGTQILSVNFAPTDATNYNSVNNTTVSLVVNKATATISLSNLNQFYDGTPKPVTVTVTPNVGVITTTYNGSTTPPSAIESYSVSSTLNNSNYTATPATGTLVISSNAATIYITNYANLVYNGNPQTPTVTCAYSYTVTYNGSGTAPTNVGSYQAIATINDGIHTGADTVTMTIIKATPTITWSNPTSITYGTALSGTQLNASSTVAGIFAYSPVSGTVLNAGSYILSTTLTPTDASNYNTATATVSIIVNKATATITVTGYTQTYDGTPKPVIATISPIVSGLIVTYNGSTTAPTNSGSYSVSASLVNSNYTASPVSGTLVISKVTPILTYPQPSQIDEGTALSSTQLDATSNIAGTFTYNYAIGTKLKKGVYTLTATFTPTDATNYNGGTVSTQLTVVGNPVGNSWISKGKTIWKN